MKKNVTNIIQESRSSWTCDVVFLICAFHAHSLLGKGRRVLLTALNTPRLLIKLDDQQVYVLERVTWSVVISCPRLVSESSPTSRVLHTFLSSNCLTNTIRDWSATRNERMSDQRTTRSVSKKTTNGLKEEDLVLWKSPVSTTWYAILESIHLIQECLRRWVILFFEFYLTVLLQHSTELYLHDTRDRSHGFLRHLPKNKWSSHSTYWLFRETSIMVSLLDWFRCLVFSRFWNRTAYLHPILGPSYRGSYSGRSWMRFPKLSITSVSWRDHLSWRWKCHRNSLYSRNHE